MAAPRSPREARAIEAQFRTYGEPVTLPGGVVVDGVVTLDGGVAELRPRGTEAAGRVPLSNLVMPHFVGRTADLGALTKGAVVNIRGVTYLVVALTPDGLGKTVVELMLPGAESEPRPEWRQWR